MPHLLTSYASLHAKRDHRAARVSPAFFGDCAFMNRYRSNDNWAFLLNRPPLSMPEGRASVPSRGTDEPSGWPALAMRGSALLEGVAMSLQAPLLHRSLRDGGGRHEAGEPAEVQSYADHLVKEIGLWGKQLGRIPLAHFHCFGDLFSLFSTSTLTRLIYTVSRNFLTQGVPGQRRVAELDGCPDSPEFLALLSGLGFNVLCLNQGLVRDDAFELNTLSDWIQVAQDYGFKQIFVRLDLTNEPESQARDHLTTILRQQPDGILFKASPREIRATGDTAIPTPRVLREEPCCQEQLLAAGYRAANDRFFIHHKTDLRPLTRCLAGSGLGALSFAPSSVAQNTGRIDHYYQMIQKGVLPIQHEAPIHWSA